MKHKRENRLKQQTMKLKMDAQEVHLPAACTDTRATAYDFENQVSFPSCFRDSPPAAVPVEFARYTRLAASRGNRVQTIPIEDKRAQVSGTGKRRLRLLNLGASHAIFGKTPQIQSN
jgi:hypothetical protein